MFIVPEHSTSREFINLEPPLVISKHTATYNIMVKIQVSYETTKENFRCLF